MSYLRNLGRAIVGRAPFVRASAVGGAVTRYALGRPVWSGRDALKQATEGYARNPVAHRCIVMIAEAIAGIPICVYRGKGDARTELDGHPLLDLLNTPNPLDDRASLLEAIVTDYLVAGNVYVERTGEQANLGTIELFVLRPHRMRVVPGADGLPMAYEHTASGGTRRFPVDLSTRTRRVQPILHIKRLNPSDDWYGLSALDPAGWSVDTHTEASEWNLSLLRNSASPSGAFVMQPSKDGTIARMSDDEFERLKGQIDDNMAGGRNAGRPLLLENGLDWRTMGFAPSAMQYVDGKASAAREIAFALGVPPLLLGLPGDNTYANYAEANRAFYRLTVLPLAKRILDALTRWMGPERIGKDVAFVHDVDDLDALAPEREAQWARLNAATFISLDEKRTAAGYEPRNIDGSDDLFVDAGKLPVGYDATIPGDAAPIDITPQPKTIAKPGDDGDDA